MRPIAIVSFALLVFLLSACGSTPTEPTDKVPVAPASMFFEREYPFCGAAAQDKFVLGYHGNRLRDTTVHLYVICHDGDTVYHDTWEAALFLNPVDSSLSDSLATDKIHAQMRALIDGKLPMAVDSTLNLAAGPLAFSYAAGSHGHLIEWSEETGKVKIWR